MTVGRRCANSIEGIAYVRTDGPPISGNALCDYWFCGAGNDQTLRNASANCVILICGQCYGSKDSDNGHHDHQLNERKAA